MYKAIQTTSYSKVQPRKSALNTIFAKTFLTLVAVLLLAPFNFMAPAFGQTEPPPPGMNGPGDPGAAALSPGAQTTDPTARQFPDEPPTNLVIQAAEQNKDTVITEVDELLTDNFRAYNETYQGLHTFWGDDIISNLFANIGQLIGKWLTEFINGWVSDTVQFLTGFLRVFVLNPNIAINGLNGNAADDISPYIRQAADVMYGIAVDLLLLLFILCIWKFWAEAAWRGGGNLMGAVGRLIFTSGLMLAWPTIYAFEIQITNEMIKTLYFNSADQVSALDAAMAAAVKGGLLAGAGLIANATAPIAGQAFGGVLGAGPGGLVLGTVGSLVAFVGLIIYLVLGGILIAELVYILVLKAIQTALLTAQYMFAPIFLVFFATPDTENVTSGFVKSFIEVSLWTFVWVGMLKILVIMILSDFNPWGKIILAVGILQLMIQVPSFLARAQISPMSDFISAGLITGGLMKAGHALSDTLGKRGMQLAKYIGGDTTTGAARGGEMSKKVGLDGLAHGVRDPNLLKDMRKAQKGEHPSQLGKNLKPGEKGDGKDGKGGDGKTPTDKDGKPIKPAGGPGSAIPGQPPKGKEKDKTGVDPAAAAAAAGKGLNTGDKKKPGETGGLDAAAQGLNAGDKKKPGETGGLDTASASKTAADALKNGLKGAGVAAGIGGALAAMQGGRQGIGGNPGANSHDEEAKKAAQLAEQAGMEAKNAANLANAGVGDDKDKEGKDKNEPPTKVKAVEGKELNTGDKKKEGEDKAKVGLGLPGSGADLSSALGKGGAGSKVDPTKTGANAGANAGKDITQPVDRTIKPVNPGDKTKEAGPGAKGAVVPDGNLANAGQKDKQLDNGTNVPVGEDGRPLNMDVEDESGAKQVGLGLPPGVKLTPGAVAGGAGDKDKNVPPAGKGADSKDLGTGKTGNKDGKDGVAGAAAPTLVGLKKPGANNQTPAAKNSSDAVVAGLAGATSVPTTGRNIDPTTALGDETATDEKGVVPEGTNLPKPLKTGADKGAGDKGAAVTADGGKDVAAGGTGTGGKQQPPVKGAGTGTGPQTVQLETTGKGGGVQLVLPGIAVAATQKGVTGAGATELKGAAGEQRLEQDGSSSAQLDSTTVTPDNKAAQLKGSGQQGQQRSDASAAVNTDVKGVDGKAATPPVKAVNAQQTVSIEGPNGNIQVGPALTLPGANIGIKPATAGAGNDLKAGNDVRTGVGNVADGSTAQGGLQQTELKSGGAIVPPGKLDAASGVNQADLKTEVTGAIANAIKGGPGGTVTQSVQVDSSVGTTTPGVSVGLNLPGAKAMVPPAKVGDGLKLDGRTPGGDATISQTGGDNQNQQTELRPGTGTVTGKVDTSTGAGVNQADLKTDVTGSGPGAVKPGATGTVNQSVQVESVGTTTPGVAVGLNLPGAKAVVPPAKIGDGLKLDGRTPGGDPTVSATGVDQGLQPTELRPGTGAVTGKVDTNPGTGVNQADLKTEVTGGQTGLKPAGSAGTVTQNVQVEGANTGVGPQIGLNMPGAKAVVPGAKVNTGEAKLPGTGTDPNVTGVDANGQQQLDFRPGQSQVTGKLTSDGQPVSMTGDVKTDVSGRVVTPGVATGAATQNVTVDGTGSPVNIGLNMPGAKATARTNMQGHQINAEGGDVDAELEGSVTGGLNVPTAKVQGIAGKQQLDVGSVRPEGTAQVTGAPGAGRVEVQHIAKPVQAAASGTTPLQAVASHTVRSRTAVPGMQMFDDGGDDEGDGGGGGGGGNSGGGNRPPNGPPTGGPWEPPDDRPAHGVAPPSPFENRLNVTGATRPLDSYQQAYYRWIPPRGISGAIRLAQGVTLGPSGHGGAELIGDTKGNTMHVRTGEGMDQDQMALQMMTAGYATLLGSDPHAYDAARASAISAGEDKPKGFAQRMAAGILTYNGGSWAQTANAKNNFQRSMYQHAVEGSQAYVNGQPGNEYTEYLSQRYGTMSDKQQAFGVHLMTDPSSPESSWHWAHVPATETLVKNSIPINAVSRAVAANPNVFRARPWEQRAAITGGIQYMEARKAQEVPDMEPMVADAWVGREAQLLAPAVINTITALTSELGEDACGAHPGDVERVNNVANIVGAGADQKEYVRAYQALANVEAVAKSAASRTSSPPPPPTSGGGVGVVRGPSGGGGGFSGGGGATTSVSGTILGGGGGSSSGGAATVDQIVDVDPGQPGAVNVAPPNLAGITPPINPGGGGGQQVQTNIVFRPSAGFTAPPPAQGNAPIRISATTPPATLGQHTINQSSGSLTPPPMQQIVNEQVVEVEVVGTRMQNAPHVDASQIKPPTMNAPRQDVRTNVDFQVNGRDAGGGGSTGTTDRVSVEATLSDSTPQMSSQMGSYAAPSASGQTVERRVKAEIQHRHSEYGSLDPDDLNKDVANLVGQFNSPAEMAFNVVYDLHAAGFSFEQIGDDKIASTAIAVRAQDPSMMRTAAIAANALGANDFTVERTHVVQAMMDADPRWTDHNIDDKSIYGAEAIVRVHDNFQQEMTGADPGHPMGGIKAYPTKDFVDRVVMHPDFKPRPVASGSGYNPSVVNKIIERFKDRMNGKDPNYGGIYDNRGSGQPA